MADVLVSGDPDGHGRYAQLTVSDDGQLLLCHECGRWRRALGTHSWYIHGVAAAEYRRRHGLSSGQSLASPASQRRFAEMPQAQPGSAGRRALESHRDPDHARQAMTKEGQQRPQLVASRSRVGSWARRGRELVPAEVEELARAGSVVEWSRVARSLVADGVRQAEISRVTGVLAVTVSARLRRHR